MVGLLWTVEIQATQRTLRIAAAEETALQICTAICLLVHVLVFIFIIIFLVKLWAKAQCYTGPLFIGGGVVYFVHTQTDSLNEGEHIVFPISPIINPPPSSSSFPFADHSDLATEEWSCDLMRKTSSHAVGVPDLQKRWF